MQFAQAEMQKDLSVVVMVRVIVRLRHVRLESYSYRYWPLTCHFTSTYP